MPTLTSIVAVGLGGEIGVENRLPWRLKSDLRFFQRTTEGNIVIMGRKTFDSIGGCLPKRENIVLSHRATLFERHPGCAHAHGIGETLYLRERQARKQAFVIGGAVTYEQFAPFVDRYLITFVGAHFPEADAHFDRTLLGQDDDWVEKEIEVDRVEDPTADQFDFTVMELTLRNPEAARERRLQELKKYKEKNPFLVRKSIKARARNGETLDQILSWA